jgi:DNA-binding SARP family transcriptional activator/tetratricopeptide (TPR) repeat protein
MLRLGLLGELEVWRDGERQTLPPSRKTRALLAYLAATGREHRRDRLCSMFWEVPDDPRGSLRWSLSRLRGIIDTATHAHLSANRESVGFEPGGAEVDLLILRSAVAEGLESLDTRALQELAALFRGEFLEGMELPNQHEFQAWCLAEREDLRQTQIRLLTLLASRHAASPDASLMPLRQLVQIDPYGETARMDLLRALLAAGREQEADRQFETAEHLFRELGGDAASRLARQWRALRTRGLTTPEETPASVIIPAVRTSARHQAMQAPMGRAPFVGRQAEQRRLAAAVAASAKLGEVGVTLLIAEPGLGKSRLIAETCATALADGIRVFSGRAYDGGLAAAYAPWADALGDLPGVADGVGLVSGREQLFGAVIQTVTGDGSSPVLVALDDMHWSDEASADLLHKLIRAGRRMPLSVLIGARGGELGDNAAMSAVLRSLRTEGLVDEMRLAPLPVDAIAELASALAPPDQVKRIVALSGGNPLFALELSKDLPSHDDALPPSLRELLRERLDRLPSSAAELLRWAAILGPSFRAELLQNVAGLAPLDILQALDLVERHDMLRPAGDDTYGFSHDLVRRAVLATLSSPRRKFMHLRVADALAAEADDSSALELATHAAEGGNLGMAARACVAAGRRALRVFAHVEALALVRAGNHHAEGLSTGEGVARRVELAEIEVAADRNLDRPSAISRIAALAETALDSGLPEYARRCYTMLAHLRWQSGEWQGAQRDTLQAEFVSRLSDDKERVVAMAEAARCLAMLERDMEQAESLVLEAFAMARRLLVEPNAIHDALGLLRAHQGEFAEAEQHFARGREIARRDGDRINEYLVLEHHVMLHLDEGKVDPSLCEELVEMAARIRPGSELAFAQALRALCSLSAGQREAEARLDQALVALREADARHRLAIASIAAARFFLRDGNLDRATALAREAHASAQQLERASDMAQALSALVEIELRREAPIPEALVAELQAIASKPVSASARAASVQAIVARQGAPR